MLNRVSCVALTGMVLALSGCGGGGAEGTGDVGSLSVNPIEQLYTCTTGSTVDGAVSVHVVNGGQAPFRIKPVSVMGLLTVGTVNGVGTFTPASSFNTEGYWVLNGRDPSFAIRVNNMPCDSDTSVLVLDGNSTPVTVTITTQKVETTTATITAAGAGG